MSYSRLVAVFSTLMLLNGISFASEQCDRLFISDRERATCVTLLTLRSKAIPDDELRDLVREQIGDISASEPATTTEETSESEFDARAEVLNAQDKSQCGQLFPRGVERDVCIWGGVFTSRIRSDEEQKTFVAEQLERMKTEMSLRDQVSSTVRRIEDVEIQNLVSLKQREAHRAAEAKLEERQAAFRKHEAERMQVEMERQADIARKQYEIDEKARVADQKRREAAARAAAQRLDAELKTGRIGFKLTGWEFGGFGSVVIIRFLLQNNTQSTAKDFQIECDTVGASGTMLNRVRNVLYEALAPGRRSSFELNMGFVNSQATRVGCAVMGWK